MTQSKTSIKPNIVLYFDGLAEPNPGTASYGWLIKSGGRTVASGKGVLAGKSTNNEAEYTALIRGLEALAERGLADGEAVEIRGDSQLAIRQMTGRYRVNSPRLRPLYQKAIALVQQVGRVSWRWVPREENEEADALSREAYKEETGQDPEDIAPPCPECGARMVGRKRRSDGSPFWGCSNFGKGCRGTRPVESEGKAP